MEIEEAAVIYENLNLDQIQHMNFIPTILMD